MPALIAPRNAVGQSMVSCIASSTRCSCCTPRPTSALANRLTRLASSPYVIEPVSSMKAVLLPRPAARLRSTRSCAALYARGISTRAGLTRWSAVLNAGMTSSFAGTSRHACGNLSDVLAAVKHNSACRLMQGKPATISAEAPPVSAVIGELTRPAYCIILLRFGLYCSYHWSHPTDACRRPDRSRASRRGCQAPRHHRTPRARGARAPRHGAQEPVAGGAGLRTVSRPARGGRSERLGAAPAQRGACARHAPPGASRRARGLRRAPSHSPLPRPAAIAPARGRHLQAHARFRPRGIGTTAAHRLDRPARRRQDHTGSSARDGARHVLRRARSRNRARSRHQPVRDLHAVRPARVPAHRAALSRGGDAIEGAGRADGRRRGRVRARHVQPAAHALLHRVDQGRTRGAHGAGDGAGRLPADAGQHRSDGRPAPHPHRARGALSQGRCDARHERRASGAEPAETAPTGERRRRCLISPEMLMSEAAVLAQESPPLSKRFYTYDTSPDQYRHWKLSFDGAVATLALDVNEDAPLNPGYKLKLNSYDLGVDIELHDALQRLRFEHPEVRSVIVTSARDRIFCSGANIFMLGLSSHAWKVNF